MGKLITVDKQRLKKGLQEHDRLVRQDEELAQAQRGFERQMMDEITRRDAEYADRRGE